MIYDMIILGPSVQTFSSVLFPLPFPYTLTKKIAKILVLLCEISDNTEATEAFTS